MSDELTEKDIKNVKKMEKQVTQEKQPQVKIKEKSFEQLWKEGAEKEKREKYERKQQAKKERLEKLTAQREELLHEKKQTLEIEKSKADIRKLRGETSVFGKLLRAKERIQKKQKVRRPPTRLPTDKKPTRVTKVTDVGRYKLVIVDGKPMSFDTQTGKLTSAKRGKQKKKKDEIDII